MKLTGYNKSEIAERYYKRLGKFTTRKQATSNFNLLKRLDRSIIWNIICEINEIAYFNCKIAGTYQVFDDREISDTQILNYMKSYRLWQSKNYSDPMERGMMKPDYPNCMYSNNN